MHAIGPWRPRSNVRRTGFALALALVALCSSQCRPASPDAGRWACQQDGDCMNSCSLGAVNALWYRTHVGETEECGGGCANQVSAPPRCIEGSCVAFQREPSGAVTRREGCTRKPDRGRR